MKQVALLAMMTVASLQNPQGNNGVLEGRVTRSSLSAGISDVRVTLTGPFPVNSATLLGQLYTPNAALTPAMRERIDQLIGALITSPGLTREDVAYQAIRLEARLLGLPIPPRQEATTAAKPTQMTMQTDGGGLFAFRNLAPGRYEIRAEREGYFNVGGGTT